MIRNFKTTGFTNPEVSSSLSPHCAVFVTSLYGCVQTQVNLFSDGLVRVNPVDNGEMVEKEEELHLFKLELSYG